MRAYLLAFVLAGCGLYWNGEPPPDAPDECAGAGYSPGSGVEFEMRDPNTGVCQSYGPETCGCIPCGVDVPNYAQCPGRCEVLDEASCLAASGCHAAVIESGAFLGCWEVEPTGPIEGGSCTGLDAYTCTAHDDCIGVYNGTFDHCAPEPEARAACSSLTTEAACTARADCDPIYTGSNCTCDEHGCTCETETFEYCGGDPTACDNVSCASGTECALAEDGTAQCVAPTTAGTCGGDVACDLALACPPGTTPGVSGLCYTTWCIPLDECGPEIH